MSTVQVDVESVRQDWPRAAVALTASTPLRGCLPYSLPNLLLHDLLEVCRLAGFVGIREHV